MKRYQKWILRANFENTEVTDDDIMRSIAHMIKCTSVRRHTTGRYAVVRPDESACLDRPVFLLFDIEERQLLGICFPQMYNEDDIQVMNNTIDSMSIGDVDAHLERLTAESRGSLKRRGRPPQSAAGAQRRSTTTSPCGSITISISGAYSEMNNLIPKVNDALRGSGAHMTVVNS